MNTLSTDLLLVVSGYLTRKDLYGFNNASKFTVGVLLWSYEDQGIHLCLGCDLTGSMNIAYRMMKDYLKETLINLKKNQSWGRVLASSMMYWDLDRAMNNKPYVRIQPPSENISKLLSMIEDAHIDSGGGPECGGIALCELNRQFRNRWIGKHGNFNSSLDILVLCMDAPFHFIVDNSSYYEMCRRHNIQTDWIQAFHELTNSGVLIVLFMINEQPKFKQAMDLIGGFNTALGGISLSISRSHIKDMSRFIETIAVEERERRGVLAGIYKRMKYKAKMSGGSGDVESLMKICVMDCDMKIRQAAIPDEIIIKPSQHAIQLSKCGSMREAEIKGLLECEAVMKRLSHDKYNYINVKGIGFRAPPALAPPALAGLPPALAPPVLARSVSEYIVPYSSTRTLAIQARSVSNQLKKQRLSS